jgi:predicted amidohydrolase
MLACAFGWRGRAGMRSATAIAILAVAAALAFGQSRLAAAPEVADGPEVALIAQDRLADRGDVAEFWRAYGQELASAAQPGRIVILPEAMLVLPQGIANEVANQLASLARSRSATIVAGLVVEQDRLTTNRALVVQPDGGMVWYHKQHLVPVFESSISPGRSPVLLEVAGARTGIAICKDMHFPSLGRDYARQGADLMLVPAADFVVDAWMASRMTALRGVEGGYAIARTARTGSLTISDRYGRILAEQRAGRGRYPDRTAACQRPPRADDLCLVWPRLGPAVPAGGRRNVMDAEEKTLISLTFAASLEVSQLSAAQGSGEPLTALLMSSSRRAGGTCAERSAGSETARTRSSSLNGRVSEWSQWIEAGHTGPEVNSVCFGADAERLE